VMSDADFTALLQDLQGTTALGRLNGDEARAVFDRLTALGYVLTKPADV
jgi:hypothetical protein